MSLRVTIGAGLVLLAGVLPVGAQTALQWKFKEGDKFTIEAVTETKQTVTVGDKSSTSVSTFTTLSTFEVKKVDAGSYTLEQTIDGVKVKSNKSDDSTVALASRFANQLKGTTFRFTINPSGRITSPGLEGYDELMRKLSGGREAAEKEVRALRGEDTFKEELGLIFGFLPEKPVNTGESWTRKERLAMPLGTLMGEAVYTYRGKVKEGESIDVARKWTYELPKEGTGGIKITKGELKVDQAAANILADPQAGRLVNHKQTLHVVGRLTTTDTTMKDTTYDVDQTTTRTLRRVDETPPK